jgi:hypothetical protein
MVCVDSSSRHIFFPPLAQKCAWLLSDILNCLEGGTKIHFVGWYLFSGEILLSPSLSISLSVPLSLSFYSLSVPLSLCLSLSLSLSLVSSSFGWLFLSILSLRSLVSLSLSSSLSVPLFLSLYSLSVLFSLSLSLVPSPFRYFFLSISLSVLLSLFQYFPLRYSLSLSLCPTYRPNALRCEDWWQYWRQGRTVTPSFRISVDSNTERTWQLWFHVYLISWVSTLLRTKSHNAYRGLVRGLHVAK